MLLNPCEAPVMGMGPQVMASDGNLSGKTVRFFGSIHGKVSFSFNKQINL